MNGIKTDPQNDGCRTSLSEERQLEKWLPLVRSRANAFRRSGIEPEDLIQEGLIGLLYAVRAFKADCGASFETFAYVCITNRLRSAVVRLGKQLSFASPEGDMADMAKFLNSDGEEDPQELFISGCGFIWEDIPIRRWPPLSIRHRNRWITRSAARERNCAETENRMLAEKGFHKYYFIPLGYWRSLVSGMLRVNPIP